MEITLEREELATVRKKQDSASTTVSYPFDLRLWMSKKKIPEQIGKKTKKPETRHKHKPSTTLTEKSKEKFEVNVACVLKRLRVQFKDERKNRGAEMAAQVA